MRKKLKTYSFKLFLETVQGSISTEVLIAAYPYELFHNSFIDKCYYLAVKDLRDSGYDLETLEKALSVDYSLLPYKLAKEVAN
ncbi:hypothetical protein [Bacillus cihuensis]|uniref:hypothetical protein n=1 Tax=Bacillus cihuensis TaxID=1208599 RepID=UPI000420B012|nr:hypothetical protein [Bacillus cihuensis]